MFYPYQHNLGDVPVMHQPSGAIVVHPGTALTMTGGKLALATGTTKPTYISLYEGGDTAVEDGKVIPVEPVYPSTVFETTLTEASASLKAGTAYTISADGASITTTTADGVAEVVNFDGKAVGDKVRVRFA